MWASDLRLRPHWRRRLIERKKHAGQAKRASSSSSLSRFTSSPGDYLSGCMGSVSGSIRGNASQCGFLGMGMISQTHLSVNRDVIIEFSVVLVD